MSYKLLTWNILADCCAKNDARGFPYVDPTILEWIYRKPRLINIIRSYAADIICLQEVDKADEMIEAFPEYNSNYYKHKNNQHGVLLLIRKTITYESRLIPFSLFFLSVDKNGNEIGKDVNSTKSLDANTSVSQGMVQVTIQTERGEIKVITTHLKAKSEFERVRIRQVEAMLNLTEDDQHVIICGDFNNDYYDKDMSLTTVCKMMTEHFHSVHSSTIDQQIFSPFPIDPSLLPITTVKKRDTDIQLREIDYIWYRGLSIEEKIIHPVVLSTVGLPASNHPSDHIPLFTKFKIM